MWFGLTVVFWILVLLALDMAVCALVWLQFAGIVGT